MTIVLQAGLRIPNEGWLGRWCAGWAIKRGNRQGRILKVATIVITNPPSDEAGKVLPWEQGEDGCKREWK